MADIEHWFSAAHEQFRPSDLLEQAIEAERAGFDAVACSDHYQPWGEPGESGMAWVWLGSVAQATKRVPVGRAVTAPLCGYHPGLVARVWAPPVSRPPPAPRAPAGATLEALYPGRTFLGIGSGESLNESPLGMDWPPVGEQLDLWGEGLEITPRLFGGERLDTFGHFPMKQAYLHTNPGRRPPIYVSAFGSRAGGIGGRGGPRGGAPG